MSRIQADQFGSPAAQVSVNRWRLDEPAATAALDETANDVGVDAADPAASVGAAELPDLRVVNETSVESDQREFGFSIVYGRRERPLVEVRVGSAWYRGRLCNQIEAVDGWWLTVVHYLPEHRTARLAKFAVHDVRRVSVLPQWQLDDPRPNGPDEPPPDDPSGLGGPSAA